MSQADRYMKLAALAKRTDTIDSSYHAAFYLLSHDPELWETACRYVTADGIGFTGLKRAAREFDERTRHIVDIAHNLFSWNSTCKATPFEISRLGYPLMEQVCNALYIAAGEVQVVITQGQDGKAKMSLDNSHYQNTKRICSRLEQFSRVMAADMVQDEAEEPER
ncbi:MAG: hypothetical protein PHE09_02605 [Oscillospiraceae bacterium]|nr:hypothetical protein [Oscillospiraceae bacterium]